MGFDLFKAIFGGSTSTQQSTSTPLDMTPQEFQGMRGPFATELMKMLSAGGGPQYGGPLNADETANEQAIRGDLMNTTGPGTARSGYLQDTIGGKFLPGQAGANPFLDAAITSAQRPTMRNLEETLGRALPGRFTQAGHFTQSNAAGQGGSSAFDRAAAIATEGAANAMKDIASNMSFGAYEGERGRQQQAVALDQQEVDATVKNLQAQALPRLIQELGIERGLALFTQRNQQLMEFLKVLGGVTAPTIGNQQQMTANKEDYGKGVFGNIFPKGLTMPS